MKREKCDIERECMGLRERLDALYFVNRKLETALKEARGMSGTDTQIECNGTSSAFPEKS